MPRFIGCEGDPIEATARLRVAVFGLGSVGRNVALNVVRLNPRELILVDPARYKPESLLTQPIDPADVGQPKARSTAELCRRIAPTTHVEVLTAGLDALDLSVLADCDLVFLAVDNLRAEQQAGSRCTALGRPLIQASVHGGSLTAQVRVFANRDGGGCCPLCAFGPQEWRHLNRETRFSCEPSAGVEGAHLLAGASAPTVAGVQVRSEPTVSVSALCSLAADLAVVQMLRLTLGLGADVADTLLEYNGYTSRTVVSRLRRSAGCPADHLRWEVVDVPDGLGHVTLHDLALRVGVRPKGVERAAFSVGGQRFYDTSVCPEGHRQSLRRFLTAPTHDAVCWRCGGGTVPEHFESHDPVPGSVLRNELFEPIRSIADEVPGWILVRDRDRATMFRARRQSTDPEDLA